MEKLEVLRQNLKIAQGFQPMQRRGDAGAARPLPATRRRRPLRALQGVAQVRQSRRRAWRTISRSMSKSKEVKEMMKATQNTATRSRSYQSIGRSKSMSKDFTRRRFLEGAALATGGSTDGARPAIQRRDIPQTPLGKTGLQSIDHRRGRLPSRVGEGLARPSASSTRPSTRASTSSTTAWDYHDGKSEEWMGEALKGKRDKVILMTKVCTHGRDKNVAMSSWRNRCAACRRITWMSGRSTKWSTTTTPT